MIAHFLKLEWKQNYRSANWQKSVFLKILIVFFGLYFTLLFLSVGIGGFYILKEKFPTKDPLEIVNSFLLFFVVGDLIFRYMLQKLPVLNIQPLLLLKIKKSAIVHYILVKSGLSFYNFLSYFFYIPFTFVLLKEGYPTANVLGWLFAMVCLVQCVNYFNFIINKNTIVFGVLIALFIGGYIVQHYQLFNLPGFVGQGFSYVYENPLFSVLFFSVAIILYIINFKQLRTEVYLDKAISQQVKEVQSANLSFVEKLGDVAPFIKNDLRLIWRNKRTKSSVWMLFLGLLYGLFFYTQPTYLAIEAMFIFVGIFSTGIFLMNFGQFIPAWDSSYYNMLMTQNFNYERYLKSKFILMSISVVLLFVLGIPYVYFGWKILVVHFAAMIYNVGVNTHVLLYGGSFNRKKINLNEKAAFNYQGTGAVQWLIGIPILILPMAIFGLLNWLISFEIAVTAILLLGFLGLLLHQKLMVIITKKYKKAKYIMVHAFKQEN